MCGQCVGGDGTPVVTDDDRVRAASTRLVHTDGIRHQCGDVAAAVGRNLRGCVAAQERCDDLPATLGQRRTEVAPRVRGVGEAVQQDRERAGVAAPRQRAEGHVGEGDPRLAHAPILPWVITAQRTMSTASGESVHAPRRSLSCGVAAVRKVRG